MTHANVDYSALEGSLKAFFEERFSAIEILSVSVDEDCDRDGERIIEITVRFEGTPKEIARNEPPGLLRSLQEQLWSLSENAFPVVRFRPSAAA